MLGFTHQFGVVAWRSSAFRPSVAHSRGDGSAVGISVRVPSRTRVCFEGIPPTPPPGFFGEGEWDDHDEEEKFTWNPLALYARNVNEHPITTKVIASAITSALGDLISQYMEFSDTTAERFQIKLRRLFSVTAWFSLVGTPLLHHWFGFLERIFPGTVPFKAVKQMLIDQAFWAAFFNAQLLWGVDVLEGTGPVAAAKNVKAILWNVLVANWKLWPAVQLFNFSVVPMQFRVLTTNVVALFWTIILTTMAHESHGGGAESH